MESWYNLTYFYKEIKKKIIRKFLTLFFMEAITKMILRENTVESNPLFQEKLSERGCFQPRSARW